MTGNKPQSHSPESASGSEPSLNPGDEAAPGMPGTGEDTCPTCDGTGRVNGAPCPDCGGTGMVIQGIGGA